mgnify:CR=1 FL=1|jgi:fused signal recognition particle receptor
MKAKIFMIFNYFKRKSNKAPEKDNNNKIKTGFSSLCQSLSKLSLGKAELDNNLKEELKKTLILSDMGTKITSQVISTIEDCLKNSKATTADVKKELGKALKEILVASNPKPLHPGKPCSILMIGINGAGKTTTCGKLAEKFSKQGSQVLLAAGDTFRAAAIEQLQNWGERTGVTVIAQQQGSDSASVIYDALDSAQAKQADYLIADTSGRLHTQTNLMDELKKIKKVMQKKDNSAPHETWLVLDASLGQNNIQQAKTFKEQIGITGLIITKLDGSAKGGSIFNIAQELKLPIHYIGVGETVDDLKQFNSEEFVNSILE